MCRRTWGGLAAVLVTMIFIACGAQPSGDVPSAADAAADDGSSATVDAGATIDGSDDGDAEPTDGSDGAVSDDGGDAGDGGPILGTACSGTTKQCNGTNVMSCVAGTWQVDSTCTGASPVCENGECVVCANGQLGCVSSTPRTCVANQWQYQTACSGANAVCLDGTCVQCTPGAKQCNGNTPQLCSANGTWQDQTACSGATPLCLPATVTCVACAEGDKKCSGLDSLTCDATNQWVKTQTCSYVCAGAGVCNVCKPNDFRCNAPPNSSGDAETCNADGQWYKATTSCLPQCSGLAVYTVDDTAKTVADSSTGLTWERGIKYGAGYINYADSVAHCTAKGAGWRLPTIEEINGLRAQVMNLGACDYFDEAAFPGFVGNGFIGVWTSTSTSPGTHVVGLSPSTDLDTNLHNVMCVK